MRITVDLDDVVGAVMEIAIYLQPSRPAGHGGLATNVSASVLSSAHPLTSLQATLGQLRGRISERLDTPPELLQIIFQVSPLS
jgi:hypothetical protein